MLHIRRHRPSPAFVLAALSLFVSLGGTSYAVIKVGSAQVTNNSIRSIDLRNNDIRGADVKNGSLRFADLADAPMYAHVDANGVFDPTRSTAGVDMKRTTYGTPSNNFPVYCFALPRPAANIQATVEDSTTDAGGGLIGFGLAPLNATIDVGQITSTYACPAGFRDAAVIASMRPDSSLYALFLSGPFPNSPPETSGADHRLPASSDLDVAEPHLRPCVLGRRRRHPGVSGALLRDEPQRAIRRRRG